MVVDLGTKYEVSIPVGFSSPLQQDAWQSPDLMPVSFNPCRVFKSAATIGQRIKANFLQPGFNPCRVFKSAATARKDVYISGPTKFQSLSGFQVRCNATTGISNASGVLFQSLSGFQVRCNLPTNGCPFCDGTRFNPCRVFKSAATGLDEVLAEVPTMFQSLSGFQVRCNPIFLPCHEILWQVSIPVGFSSPLQRRNPRLPSIPSLSFNPCRVFKSAATEVLSFVKPPEKLVSIPVGFSSPLQHNDC